MLTSLINSGTLFGFPPLLLEEANRWCPRQPAWKHCSAAPLKSENLKLPDYHTWKNPTVVNLRLWIARRTAEPGIKRGNGALSRSIHPSPGSYSDRGQLPDRGLSGVGLRWKSGRVPAPPPPPHPSPPVRGMNAVKEGLSWFGSVKVLKEQAIAESGQLAGSNIQMENWAGSA